jgi:hypothetical protein
MNWQWFDAFFDEYFKLVASEHYCMMAANDAYQLRCFFGHDRSKYDRGSTEEQSKLYRL